MAIMFDGPSLTITVTGGSWDNPFTAADIASDPTAGAYVSTGGYGDNVYTFSANLVLGSTAGDTFFDIVGSILKCDTGYSMSIYAATLQGGNTDFTWAAKTFGPCQPVISPEARKMVTSGILKAYVQSIGVQCVTEGHTVDVGMMGPVTEATALASCASGGMFLPPGACPVCVPPCPTAEIVHLVQEVVPLEEIIPLTEIIPAMELIPAREVTPDQQGLGVSTELKSRIVFVFSDSEVL